MILLEKMREITEKSVHIVSVHGDSAGKMKSISGGGAVPAYKGPTTFTPSGTTQTVDCEGKRMKDNITINAIPANYGRLSWDGHTLTVY